MTSVYFKLNPYVVIEYQYNSKVISTSQSRFRKIFNKYTGFNTIVNDNNSIKVTGNTINDTLAEISDELFVLLDNDSAFFYPNIDPNIVVTDVVTPTYNVTYDRIRLHILSGYNFEDVQGFMTSIYLRTQDNSILKLSNFLFDKGKKELIYFNPKPIRFVDFIYDKYVEYYVPSAEFMIDQQIMNPDNPNDLSYLFNDSGLSQLRNIYCEYNNIVINGTENGITYYKSIDGIKISFNTTDDFDKLTANIVENENGYFEYAAKYDGQPIEDFIFKLNSLAGNKYIIIHDLVITEQLGESFIETDNLNIIQQDNYDLSRRIRPIMRFGDTATSLNIDYMIRLYDQNSGKSIFKRSSISSLNTRLYGVNQLKLNIGDTTRPLKIYNKRFDNVMTIQDNFMNIVQTKIMSVYVNNNDILIEQNNKTVYQIEITPFDNFFKFNLTQTIDGVKKHMVLDMISSYYMVFIKNDNTKLTIDEFKSAEFNKNEGQLAFKISKQKSLDIITYNNKYFYIINKNADGLETVLFKGLFTN